MEDPTALGDGLLPLWPFQTADQVEAWRRHRLAVGGSPHHRLDPAQTALEFTRGALGLTSVDRITYVQADGRGRGDDGCVVGVGLRAEAADLTVARLRLARLGSGPDAPWVVTGTLDADAVERPAYGADVTSPLEVGGRLTGADEALRVLVTGPGGTTLARSEPFALGGVEQPWRVSLELAAAPPGALLAVAVITGGHVADVEWLAVTAARLSIA